MDESSTVSKGQPETIDVNREPELKPEDADNIEQTGRLDVKTECEANLENNNVPQEDSSSTTTTTPNGVDDTESQSESNEETKHRPNRHEPDSSRRLTQQNSLIAPSEIHITTNDVYVADRMFNTEEKLRRLDNELHSVLMRKQEIVCDMFKVPNEHFQAIADIAGQPEAAKEPSDLLLAAFAQIQSLTEAVNDHINVNTFREIAAVSNSICDNCYKARELLKNDKNAVVSSLISSTTSTSEATLVRPAPVEDEDGYCEIEEIRNEILYQSNADNNRTEHIVIDTSLHQESSRLEAVDIVEVCNKIIIDSFSFSYISYYLIAD